MNAKFNTLVIFSLIIMTTLSINSQEPRGGNSGSAERANEILELARKAIYKDEKKRNVKSIFLSVSGNWYDKTTRYVGKDKPRQSEERMKFKREYSVTPPRFARVVHNVEPSTANAEVPLKIEMTMVVNGDLVARSTDTFVNGQKLEVGKNPKLEELLTAQGLPAKSPRAVADSELQAEFFPLLLQDPVGNTLKFHYVGTAEADGRKADVLELQPEETSTAPPVKQTVRYFFDSESHLLLLVTKDYSFEDIEKSTSTYFSAHQLMDGLLIPTKIKEESKVVSKKTIEFMGFRFTGSEQNKITDLEINKFEIGREFPGKLFEIKK